MRVMICLGQGGLRSLSASSFYIVYYFISYRLNHSVFDADDCGT